MRQSLSNYENTKLADRDIRTIIQHAPVIVFSLDANAVFTRSEGQGLEYLGLKDMQVVGVSILEMYGHIPWIQEGVTKAYSTLEPTHLEGECEGRWYDVHLYPTIVEGQISQLLGIAIDLTDQRRATLLLNQQIAAFRASIDGLAILDASECYTFVNTAHASIYGFQDPSELIGKPWAILYSEPELERFKTVVIPDLLKNGTWKGEAIGRRKDGTSFPQEVSLSKVDIGGLVCIVRDISERKKQESQLLELQKRTEQAVHAREDLIATVSHDLINPLTAISVNGTLLTRLPPEKLDSSTLQKISKNIEISVEQMRFVIRDLLDMEAIQNSNLTLNMSSWNSSEILQKAYQMFESISQQKSLRLQIDRDTSVQVRCDVEKIFRVLSNLLGNAMKFTPPGGKITLGAILQDSSLQFYVRDDGPGIANEEIPYIFDRYWKSKKVSKKGIGLGLSIAKSIVQAHHGQIWVDSRLGYGCTFYFTLPIKPT
jgi:PAS domain S-box-containing protein